MPYPTAIVEIAFTDTPYQYSPTWVDVTSYVREITTRRGRSDEFQDFGSGTATITLDNRDRRFDPLNESSPYYIPAYPTRTNLITNPSFETNTTGWTNVGGATIARTSGTYYSGAWSVAVQRTSTTGQMGIILTPRIDVTAGLAYTFSIYFQRDYSTTRTTNLRFRWYTSGGVQVGATVEVAQTPPAVNTWGRFSSTQTAPATAASVEVACLIDNAIVGETAWMDAALVEQASTLYPYFDGSSPGAVWNGTANASTSTRAATAGYTNLTPRKQIRVRASNTVSSVTTTYDVFRGYVSGWPVSLTDAGFDSTVTLECFDALGLLASEECPEDFAAAYILSSAFNTFNLVHFWPLTDPADPGNPTAYRGFDFGPNPVPIAATAASAAIGNGGGLAEGLPDQSLYVAGNSVAVGAYENKQGATNINILLWSTYQSDQNTQVFEAYYANTLVSCYYDISYDRYVVNTYDGTARRDYIIPIVLNLSVPHHVAVMTNAGGTSVIFYVDGIAQTVTYTGSALSTVTSTQDFFRAFNQTQQVAVFCPVASYITAALVSNLYRISRNIFSETSSARFNRIIDQTNFNSLNVSTPASPVATVGAFTTGGPPVANELEVISDSEGGNLFVTKSGVVTMTGRNQFATGTSLTSQATIGTTGITIGTTLDYRIDAENMRNQLAVGFSGDGSIEVSNTASIDAYGVAGGSTTTQLTTAEAAQTLGQFLVGFSKDPAVVISPVEVNVSAVAADWATVLSLELLNRITFTLQPRTGASFTQQQLIQSIEHRVIPGQWSTTINGSVRFTNPFIIGSSLLGGSDLLL